jgi:hypothetical protein
MILVLASLVFFGSECLGTLDYIVLPQILDLSLTGLGTGSTENMTIA